ncbi:MAG: agmatinase [Deltaproteobacteria bacterium]|nr:MAG: agmatinase [Deltaproteobacteria bacterium]
MATAYTKYPPFLGSELDPPAPEAARFHILPVPFEGTVSYGSGTAAGPAAVLAASQQLELFDGTDNPSVHGILTLDPVDCTGDAETIIRRIRDRVMPIAERGKIPVLIGGEHSVTAGALDALKQVHGRFGVVQIDAHADLRDTYDGTPHSHACVMRRAFDMGLPLFQAGVRSLSPEEVVFRADQRIAHLDAPEIAMNGIPDPLLPDAFPLQIYLTVDVDGMDPSIMPATGTPEPGGLNWYQTLAVIARSLSGRQLIGMDAVELAPIPGIHFPEFTVARLLYQMMGMAGRNAQRCVDTAESAE